MSIRLLDENTINKIAAGEVIERPASALKELLENSSDGGATRIEIDFDQGGKAYLKVSDDGRGIPENELGLALQRHATSKLQNIDDLNSLGTFGFRGEALSSLAAVSDLTLHSGQKVTGALIEAHGGRIGPVKPAPPISGTQITIRGLFHNLPARQKFLKSDAGETGAIKKVIKAFALSHPEISITLRQGGKVIALYERENFAKRACRVLGVSENETVLVEKSDGPMKAQILLSHPHLNLATQQGLWIFVQGRPVQDRLLQQAIIEGYRNLIMGHQYPQVVLKLQVDPGEVDVNVHPTKAQVKFLNASGLFRFVSYTIKEALTLQLADAVAERGDTSRTDDDFAVHHVQSSFTSAIDSAPEMGRLATAGGMTALKMNSSQASTYNEGLEATLYNQRQYAPATEVKPVGVMASTQNMAGPVTGPWSSSQVIGQYANTYIVAQSRHSLLLIDQHAAHERVLFERLKTRSKFEKQYALLEDLIELNRDAIEALTDSKFSEVFAQLGFEITDRGPTTLAVTARPAFLLDTSLQPLFERIAEQILEVGSTAVLDDLVTDIWASMACHGAIRAGRVLTADEMHALLKQMDEFSFSSFCPHGRPVSVKWALTELERLFKRIV